MKYLSRLSPVLRISAGVVSLLVSLVLVADSLIGLIPNARVQSDDLQVRLSNILAAEISVPLEAENPALLKAMLDRMVAITPDLKSISVFKSEERLAFAIRAPEKTVSQAPVEDEKQFKRIVVPFLQDRTKAWGNVEFAFVKQERNFLHDLLHDPLVEIIVLLSTIGLAAIYLFLRKWLQHLDPSHAVPQRVRKAFDTLTDAVIILDPNGRIVLANALFEEFNGVGSRRVEGVLLKELEWLQRSLDQTAPEGGYPWEKNSCANETIRDRELKVIQQDGQARELRMSYSAIHDGGTLARGWLVTFDDVTELSEANQKLQRSLQHLEVSAEKIRQQNEELKKHAEVDPLTGCLNRRAFFSRAEPLFNAARKSGGRLICIMGDIDHFKSFNDRYGHGVGDAVIQQTAAAMERSLRANDLLCRYGGEEFCILLVDVDSITAAAVAERIRKGIEQEAGSAVEAQMGLRVTASLGLANLQAEPTVTSLPRLIELADQALYAAKKSGRNRVTDTAGNTLSNGEPPRPLAIVRS